MIDVKQAASIAIAHVKDLFKEEAGTALLEETELSEDGKRWNITVSFLRAKDPRFQFTANVQSYERIYKTVVIDASSGEVTAMRIRTLV